MVFTFGKDCIAEIKVKQQKIGKRWVIFVNACAFNWTCSCCFRGEQGVLELLDPLFMSALQ